MRIIRPLTVAALCAASVYGLDLKHAVIVAPAGLVGPEKKIAAMLAEEIEKRTRIRLAVSERARRRPGAVDRARRPSDDRGGQRARTGIACRCERVGAVGGQRCARDAVRGGRAAAQSADGSRRARHRRRFASIATAPKYPLRGHQLGYRPKTNSYDGWDVAQWEQYIRDLAVFGTNAIELIPPRSDDAADSPHFPLPPMRDDDRDVAARRRVRPRRLDLVSGDGSRLLRSRRRSSSR